MKKKPTKASRNLSMIKLYKLAALYKIYKGPNNVSRFLEYVKANKHKV